MTQYRNLPPFEIMSERPTLVVVGGGVAGLAAAHALRQRVPGACVMLLEAGDRLGGLLHTHREDGFVVEEAAENFLAHVPWAVDLCRSVGLADQLLSTKPSTCRALVVRRGQLKPIPPGFAMMAPPRIWPILANNVLSLRGKLRLAMEPFVAPKCSDSDESIASFACRRLGRQAYERLVEPLVGSIYGADPGQLSMAATFPHLVQMERTCGSLWRGQQSQRRQGSGGPTREPFATPREGMSSLVDALAERIGASAIQLRSPVAHVKRTGNRRWAIEVKGAHSRRIFADAVVLAAPAFACARMLRDLDEALADELSRIAYRDVTLVALGYQREQIAHPLDSHGIVIPRCEGRRLHSISFSSVKYSGRAPEGTVLLRASVRQDGERPATELDDDGLREIVAAELAQQLDIRGTPIFCRVVRRRRAMPVYQIGHPDGVSRIQRLVAAHAGLALAGATYGGSGVPQCIHSGEQAAEVVLDHLPIVIAGGRHKQGLNRSPRDLTRGL